jgi:amidase
MARVALEAQATPTDFGAFVPGAICRREATGRGVLNGRTFAVKDLIDVAGCRTGAGNPTWLAQQAPAERSAPVVEKALFAGAAFIGKTVTDELAFSLEGRNVHYDRLVNPACPDRLPGGSSSGSAVAVAAGLADFALGTDTGGSVRVPANFLGLFGFRPSHGAISLDGVVPFAPSYDTVGWFARDAELLADVGAALLPRCGADPITKLFLAHDAFALVDKPLARELEAKAQSLGLSGNTSIFDGEEAASLECYRVLQGAEIWQSLGAWITSSRPDFAEDIGERFADAAAVTVDQAEQHRPVRDAIRLRFESLVPPGVAIVMPTTPCIALPRNAPGGVIGDFYKKTLTLTSIAGHCGAPQAVLPFSRWQGCPIGLSIVAARGNDGALLDLAMKLAAPIAGAA